ncbi:MAG: InlB B-repeat-containing protein, partial [Clostridia bacterium]|nr:InlB B-repeat-containing protein [Clostridia bacterium]
MKALMRKLLSAILVIAIIATGSLAGLAEVVSSEQKSTGEVFSLEKELTWAEAGKQIAGMLSYIVEDAANIDLAAYSERIANLSLEDDSVYLAILAEEGYLPEEPAQIDPDAAITAEEYMQLMGTAFPTVVNSQTAIDMLKGEVDPGNIAILGDDLSISTLLPERLAVAAAQQLSLVAVKATALSLNAASSVDLSESEFARVYIHDTAVKEEAQPGEEVEPDVIYLHMDSGTQLPEVIVKSADEVIIEGSGALGVVRVQEPINSLTVRATGSVINETEAAFEVTGPDAQVVELQPGEQVDFVLSKWLVSFVTEGTSVETQEIVPGGMVDYTKANTTLEGKIFTAWYEDADYTTPVSRLSTVDREMTLYARFVDEADAAIVTFETFGGRELEPMVFAKGEYLLTKPVESLYTSKEGYSFGGWCVDEACTTAFGYTEPIRESMTLYAMYASYEQEVREEPGTVAEVELPDGAATIGLVLPEGMTAAEALENIDVEVGTGLEIPEIAVRETESGAEIYCEAGFTPGTSFTLYVENGVQFAGYPEYIDTLTVSVFREQVEVVEFAEGLTYVLWDNVTEYTPVSKTDVEYTIDYTEENTVHNMLEDNDAESDVIPGKLIMTGEVNFQPEQVVVFYDGEINRDEAPVDSWESGDLAGYVLFAEIESVAARADGTSEVTFRYADPEDYIAELDVHTTEKVNVEECLSEEQLEQVEKTIASQLASNDELKAQLLVAVMTSEDTQQMLDDQYGPGTYSLAALIPYISNPKLDIKLAAKDSTVTAGVGVGVTVSLYGPQGLLATITPYLYFEEQLTLDINVDGGFLWLDMSVLFKTKTTVSLKVDATTGDGLDFDEALTTLREIVNADGTANEDYDYQQAADTLMETMQELIETDLEYQDLFSVPLLKVMVTFYGIITIGANVDLVGQAAVVATFGVTVTAEYGQKVGFNYNFLKFKGGSYSQKVASEVTTEVYLIGKMGVRVGIAVSLYVKLLHNVTVSITDTIYVYIELSGMFLYSYALSAGGGNYAGAIYLEVGIDAEIELTLEVEVFLISAEKSWTVLSARLPLYSWSCGMTMGVMQNNDLMEKWNALMEEAENRTSYTLPYIPMKTYDMLTATCTENQLLFENLQQGNVTAKLTLENIVLNGEAVSADDPRASIIYVGDGVKGRLGAIYADEMLAAANKVETYQCDVVLTYENKNKSELIKFQQLVLPFFREFKMATTTINVNIALYDWCAHSWGIEAAEWDNATVFETSFENTHVLGCPVEPTATGEIDLNAVIATVKEQYPDIDVSALSWFNPTLNQVDRTVQYSIPRISNMCYLTPGSNTVRYDIFATTYEYDLTFNLYANRFPGYTGEITYVIEAPEAPADAVFTVRGSDDGEELSFAPVEGEQNRWSLTAPRAAFNGTERKIMLRVNGGAPVDCGLTVTGREAESVVTLVLGKLSGVLTVKVADGIDDWEILSHDSKDMSAIMPGDKVTLSVKLKEGYVGVRLTSEPEGLNYTSDGNKLSFTMPFHDVKVTLHGVRSYQVNFMYNYGELDVYQSVDVKEGETVQKPSDPYVSGLTFAGWYDNEACEGEPYDFTQKINDNITLYADWRVNVTVDFGGAKGQAVANGYGPIFPGDETEYTRYTYSVHKLGDTALDYKLPYYDGYDFAGWYLTPDFSGDPVDPASYVLTGGVTFYASWNQIAVLTYELNYGEQEEPYAMAVEYVGMSVKNIPEAPQRENYKFLGWFRTQDASAASYIDLDTYIVEGGMTLYAGWKPVDYIITYELNGGENNPANPNLYSVESSEIVIGDPTRKGYTFLGWTATGIEIIDGVVRIPAGYSGDITLTANWERIVYTISYELVHGETSVSNPTTYTVESGDIRLRNPVADGYTFIGWTGTGLTEPSFNVVIPAGSIGNRSYKANWSIDVAAAGIVGVALNAIPDTHEMGVDDFTGMQDIRALVMETLSANETCATYLDQLTVTVNQVGSATQDETGYSYTVMVTVSFTEDSGNVITRYKYISLRVNKNPVTLYAEVDYTDALDGSYYGFAGYPDDLNSKFFRWGTQLGTVKLTADSKATDSNGVEVPGAFEWEDASAVLEGKDNDVARKLVFKPSGDAAARYCTAETELIVKAQIRVSPKIMDRVSYYSYRGRNLLRDEVVVMLHFEDVEYPDMMTGGAYFLDEELVQDSYLPGPATLTFKCGSMEFYEDSSNYKYANNGAYFYDCSQPATCSFTINRADVTLAGTTEYNVTVGSTLNDITLDLAASTNYEDSVPGTFSWDATNAELNTVGSYTYTVKFTPDNLNCYNSATIDVTVNVNKKTVAIPEIASVTYNGQPQQPNVPATDFYTVVTNNGGTNAGDYDVVLELKDAANYVWSDGDTSAQKTLTFTIAKATMTVSGTASVMPLGYGQTLKAGVGMTTDNTCANEMISGLTITGVNNVSMTGKWDWDDSDKVGVTLNASSVKDTADYGDGYEVYAKYVLSSSDQSNYEPLRQTFHVEIERAEPYFDPEDTTNLYVKEGKIFIPEGGPAVNALNLFTPAMHHQPTNPNSGEYVAGSLSWEDKDQIPDENNATANAEFTPADPKNYKTGVFVSVPLEFKHTVTVNVHANIPNLLNLEASQGAYIRRSSYTVEWTPGTGIRFGFWRVLDAYQGYYLAVQSLNAIPQAAPEDLKQYAGMGYEAYDVNGVGIGRTMLEGVSIYPEIFDINYSGIVSYNLYIYGDMPETGVNWPLRLRTTVDVNITFGTMSDTPYYDADNKRDIYFVGGLPTSTSSYSLRSRMLTTEPTAELTPAPTVEPTA